MKGTRLSHIQIIAIGYFVMIAVGTALLCLPFAARSGQSAGVVTALFTATSASCVTGLILFDTATYWSLFGQLVILLLIQIGGLGFMTIATFFHKILRKRTGLRERAVAAESINTTRMGGFSVLIRRIIAGTALFEGVGAVLLSCWFVPHFGWRKGLYFAVFHAVTAFCNAGFDLFGVVAPRSSLTSVSGNWLINAVVMILIIAGGIGFLVWDDVLTWKFRFKRYALNTKIVLTTSAVLVFGGAILLYGFELANPAFAALPAGEKVLTSLFGSVTARTAGFNSVDTAALTPASKLLTIVLMFIGGSPGSTAGGLKTTTLVVLILHMVAGMRGKREIHLFGRSLKEDALKKAAVVFVLNFSLTLCGTMLLCAFQGFSITDGLFEAVSAIGTVGMTTGITGQLCLGGKIVIMLLMFCGRVGSVSFATALLERRVKPPVTYPAEEISIG